jgi:hypothetical protein
MPHSELDSENIFKKSRNRVDFRFPILIMEIDQSKIPGLSNNNKLN